MVIKGFEFDMPFVVPPGETLKETLEEIGMSHKDLAFRLGLTQKTISKIMNGTAPITPTTALKLEHVLGVPARFWNNLELNYREGLARIELEERLQKEEDLLKRYVPYNEMAKVGFVEKTRSVKEKLNNTINFFGFSSLSLFIENLDSNDLLSGAYRISDVEQVNKVALMAWIRKGELEAQSIIAQDFSKELGKKKLLELRRLTLESDPGVFIPKIQSICAEFGVKVVFVPEVKGSKICGLTRWFSTQPQALIQLSLRYKTNDNLWFTFFHELGHILKHKKVPFYTVTKDYLDSVEEQEANNFSANLLIPRNEFQEFIKEEDFSRTSIIKFSDRIETHPGIIVGRLQKEGFLPWNRFQDLKVRYVWS